MRIPTTGDQVLVTIKLATDTTPAVQRPAVVTQVWNYGPHHATCDVVVTLNPSDADEFNLTRDHCFGLQMFVSSCTYNRGLDLMTFCYPAETYVRAEECKVKFEITHGREKIKAGAVGIWDQAKGTITFNRDDVEGLHPDHSPKYDAKTFIDHHAARLTLPEGYRLIITDEESDGSESPDERMFLVADYLRQQRDIQYRLDRMAGMPAREAGSLRKAQEIEDQTRLARGPELEGLHGGAMMNLDDGEADTRSALTRRAPLARELDPALPASH